MFIGYGDMLENGPLGIVENSKLILIYSQAAGWSLSETFRKMSESGKLKLDGS